MPNIPQEITSFFPVSETSAQTKRHSSRSDGESGSSPLLKKADIEEAQLETARFAESTHDTSATDIKHPDSCDFSAYIDYISNVMERVLHRVDTIDGTMTDMSTEINLKLDTIKKDYEQRISAVEASIISYRKETDEKLHRSLLRSRTIKKKLTKRLQLLQQALNKHRTCTRKRRI